MQALIADGDALLAFCRDESMLSALFYIDGPVDVRPVVACVAQSQPHLFRRLLSAQQPYKCNVLHHACKAGALGVLEAFVSHDPDAARRALRQRNAVGMQPLAFALFAPTRTAMRLAFELLLPLMSEDDLALPDMHGNNLFANVCLRGDLRLVLPVFLAHHPPGSKVYGSDRRLRLLARHIRGRSLRRLKTAGVIRPKATRGHQ